MNKLNYLKQIGYGVAIVLLIGILIAMSAEMLRQITTSDPIWGILISVTFVSVVFYKICVIVTTSNDNS